MNAAGWLTIRGKAELGPHMSRPIQMAGPIVVGDQAKICLLMLTANELLVIQILGKQLLAVAILITKNLN
jgi:hypothetical protein